MARYPNGRIPERELVRLGVEHYATAATAERLRRMIADVKAQEGVTLRVTGGPNVYRNLAWQILYWDVLPYPQAAYPGTSSHGGEYRGQDAMAVDIDNWYVLGKVLFYAYARRHGFTPNVFDWEPWHIVDFNPWTMPTPSGEGSESLPVIHPEDNEEEEDEVKVFGYKKAEDGRIWYVQFSPTSGFWSEFVTNDSEYARSVANKWGGGAPLLTESHRNDLKNESDDIKNRLSR